MKVYQVTLQVFDFDDLGEDEIKRVLYEARYPNSEMLVNVRAMEGRDVGPWYPEHPLNDPHTQEWEWRRLFGGAA